MQILVRLIKKGEDPKKEPVSLLEADARAVNIWESNRVSPVVRTYSIMIPQKMPPSYLLKFRNLML